MIRIPMAKPDLRGNEKAYTLQALNRTQLSQGHWVRVFEEAFAARLGVKHAIAVSSGTAALHLALLAAGVKPGDRVLVPTLTYVASVAAIRYCGAVPVFADSDPETWGLAATTVQVHAETTRAWLPVHLYGVPCTGPERVPEDGVKHGPSFWIEDAAEALGATATMNDGLVPPLQAAVGTFGDCGVFSFYANKILTTGEGGMVVTDDDGLAQEVRLLRGQGQDPTRRYWHTRIGFNYRMTDIQAAIGLAQLERLEEMLEARQALLIRYRANLMAEGRNRVTWQTLRPGTTRAPWVFACLLPRMEAEGRPHAYPVHRDCVMTELAHHGIETRPTFPCVHTMPPYQPWARQFQPPEYTQTYVPSYPVAEDIAARGLLLPLFSEMTVDQVDEVCDRLRGVL